MILVCRWLSFYVSRGRTGRFYKKNGHRAQNELQFLGLSDRVENHLVEENEKHMLRIQGSPHNLFVVDSGPHNVRRGA